MDMLLVPAFLLEVMTGPYLKIRAIGCPFCELAMLSLEGRPRRTRSQRESVTVSRHLT